MSMMRFLEYLKVVKKRTESTIKQYHAILREFQKFEPITQRSWKRYLEHIADNKPKTQANKLMVVKEYLNWKADNGLFTHNEKYWKTRYWNEAEPPKEKRLPRFLQIEDVKKLLDVIDNPYHKAIFKLIFSTGMRISELINLTREDITFEGNVARIRIIGKGNKERVVVVDRKIVEEAIQAGVFEKKITARAIQKALKKYAEKAGINQPITPHWLRHSFAVALVERGLPLNKVQAILGHSNIATTSVYLQVASSTVEIPSLL